MKRLAAFLDGLTMYRLVLCGLGMIAIIALGLAAAGFLPFPAFHYLGSLAVLFFACELVNRVAGRVLRVPLMGESAAITALILSFLFHPASTLPEFLVLAAGGAIAMLSKYVLVFRRQHLFNPAAVGAFVVGIVWPMSMPSWWIGSGPLFVPVCIFAVLLLHRIGRASMVAVFLLVSVVLTVVLPGGGMAHAAESLRLTFLSTPIVFFAAIMLTEPLTTPPRHGMRLTYAAIIGVLFTISFEMGPVYSTPELALLAGNLLFAILRVRSHGRSRLRLRSTRELAGNIREFVFDGRKPVFRAGQFMEWTLGHEKPDLRGTRRTLSIASAPSEEGMAVAVKLPEKPSSFKRALLALRPGDRIDAAQVAGDFTLPRKDTPLLFIAGGIGVTPFRGIVRAILDAGVRRDIVLVYAAADPAEFAYRELFTEAERAGVRTVYVVTREEAAAYWEGERGRVTPELLGRVVPDFRTRTAYVSGPTAMVHAVRKMLRASGVPRRRIVTDVFTGY